MNVIPTMTKNNIGIGSCTLAILSLLYLRIIIVDIITNTDSSEVQREYNLAYTYSLDRNPYQLRNLLTLTLRTMTDPK
jgi:hypothetical protein